jgi:hypothetical protein
LGGGNPADPETVALIRRLEEALLAPEVRKSSAQIAALLADEFVEIGSSGRIYDKDQIIGQLQQESGEESLRTVSDFTARELADGLILVTYRIIESRTVRSSCRITHISRATIVAWLPYVAAARLAEDVPNDFERLLEIVNL